MNEVEYENSVAKYLAAKNANQTVKYNYSIIGLFSRVSRQIDVYLENEKGYRTVVECKYYNRKIDVKTIDSFIGFLEDVGIYNGILITNKGASKAALQRVSEKSISISILDDEALKEYCLGGLMPYSSERMAMFGEPVGYVMHDKDSDMPISCLLLPIGKPFSVSIKDGTFLYINLIERLQSEIPKYLENECINIDSFYHQKSRHKIVNEDRHFIRKTIISRVKRADFCIIKTYPNGSIIVHGLVELSDFAWTLTAIKKMLKDAKLLTIKMKKNNGDEMNMEIIAIET